MDTLTGLVYVAHNGIDTVVVSFEGTQIQYKPFAAIMDLDFVPYALQPNDLCPGCACSGCNVHQGFWDVYKSYVNFVDTNVAQAFQELTTQSPKVMITGHSLGGAEAVLYALHYALISPPTARPPIVYTFGCPKVGNMNFVNFYTSKVPYNYGLIHNADIVPHLPPTLFDVSLVPTLFWCSGETFETCTRLPGLNDNAGLLNWHLSVDDHLHYFNYTTTGAEGYTRQTKCGQS